MHQIPASLPALFSGDRLVVYGVLKASENENYGSGVNEVRLEGNAENVDQVCHIIQFATPDVEDSWDNEARTEGKVLLHGLAAKNSIQEKQDDVNESSDSGPRTEKAKSYVISISKSANVISKWTSFVAVDKDSREPVCGPLQKRVPNYASMSLFVGGGRRAKITSLGGGSAFGAEAAQTKGFSFCARKKCGAIRKKLKVMKAAKSHPLKKSECLGAPQADADEESGSEIDDESFGVLSYKVSAYSPKQKDTQSLLSVISLQKASGSWNLTDQLVALCSTSRDDLIKGCPKEIAVTTAEGKLLWATALALVLLMGKYVDQKDEWEMIAEKGTKWLKKNLPSTDAFAKVLKSAAAVVGVQDIPEMW